VLPEQVEALIYTGVCRENFEPATACAVAEKVGVSSDAYVYDISNACLGVMNGIIDIANRIELKQIRAGMVVSCESAREINEVIIDRMLGEPTMDCFTRSLATLTGGSGAAAVLLTDGSFAPAGHQRRLLGGHTKAAPEHHRLCRWGVTLTPAAMGKLMFSPERLKQTVGQLLEPHTLPEVLRDVMRDERIPTVIAKMLPTESLPKALTQFMSTDSVSVLKHGVELGVKTWGAFLKKMGWALDHVDRVICHQVGSGHQLSILRELGIPPEKEFPTYPFLGNIGTVSLPLTAAIAEQRRFLQPGHKVGFLGIGSGLNCLMLGWEW
jgi:3-oxoacyl-[acyl-carrier-protein] synthase-3